MADENPPATPAADAAANPPATDVPTTDLPTTDQYEEEEEGELEESRGKVAQKPSTAPAAAKGGGYRSGGEERYMYSEECAEEYCGEEEEEESLLTSDDPEQKRRYMEYLSLIKEIECQNRLIEEIKLQIMELCAKPCKTKCEWKDIKRLRRCMETEYLKMRCLMNRAMQLQNFGSKRRYRAIPIATTIDEENLTPYVGCIPTQITNWKGKDESSEADQPSSCQDSSQADKEQQIKCLCQAMGKMKICCPEDKKLIKEIAAALLCGNRREQQETCDPCTTPPPFGGSRRRPCGGVRTEPCGSKPDPCSPCGKNKKDKHSVRRSKSHHESDCSRYQGTSSVGSLDKLKQKIICMQASVNTLKQEISKRENKGRPCGNANMDRGEADMGIIGDTVNISRPCPCPPSPFPFPCGENAKDRDEGPDPILTCTSKRNTKADQLEKLKENYLYLLAEFGKKDCQLKELQKRFKGVCGSCGSNGAGGGAKPDKAAADESELILLRSRVSEMKEEQEEFKCLMKEQATQLEDYRNKYLAAQQKVEEQNVTLEKLNLNNKRIEKQINTEIKECRAKFQEKLNELLHFPKLLENEQIKLATVCKEKEDLNAKLALVCKELKALKTTTEGPKEQDCRPQLLKCQNDLTIAQTKIEELERQRDLFCEQLKKTQEDLDTMRCESASIIARTKERAELIRQQQQAQINRVERELAQCRATACLSVSDREAVIREMQGQLNTLSYSFDAAQKQIKTLRNHVAYVSNENCFPLKC